MRLAVVGSRGFPHLAMVREFITSLPRHFEIVSGGVRGVDRHAEWIARELGMGTYIIWPDYDAYDDQHKRQAPLDRNTEIVAYSDRVVAFWDGSSCGTHDIIRKANAAGKLAGVVTP
jgi:hypothetical protein